MTRRVGDVGVRIDGQGKDVAPPPAREEDLLSRRGAGVEKQDVRPGLRRKVRGHHPGGSPPITRTSNPVFFVTHGAYPSGSALHEPASPPADAPRPRPLDAPRQRPETSYNPWVMSMNGRAWTVFGPSPFLPAFPRSIRFPDYEGLSIVAIPDLVRAAFGIPTPQGALVEAVAPQAFQRVLLVIVDGLGFHRARRFLDADRDSALARVAQRGALVPITTVFPSTTVAALSTYSTGLAPAQHGLIGYRLYLREISAVANMIQLSVVGGNGTLRRRRRASTSMRSFRARRSTSACGTRASRPTPSSRATSPEAVCPASSTAAQPTSTPP